VWLWSILTQTILPILSGEKVLPGTAGESKLKNCSSLRAACDHEKLKVRQTMRATNLLIGANL
jgi:hypothetical protein